MIVKLCIGGLLIVLWILNLLLTIVNHYQLIHPLVWITLMWLFRIKKKSWILKSDPISALEDTKRFISELLGTENTKKINVSRYRSDRVGYGVTNPKQQPQDKTSLVHKKQVVTNDYNSRLKVSKRKFDDSDGDDVKDVKKQKIIPGIMRKRPEQPKCMAKPIGKPSVVERFLVPETCKKYNFQFLVCKPLFINVL